MDPACDAITFDELRNFAPNLFHDTSIVTSDPTAHVYGTSSDVFPVGRIDGYSLNPHQYPLVMQLRQRYFTNRGDLLAHHNYSFRKSHHKFPLGGSTVMHEKSHCRRPSTYKLIVGY